MEFEISPVLFEWLLADWAGYRLDSDRAKLFPHLRDLNWQQLAGQLPLPYNKSRSASNRRDKFSGSYAR